MITELLPTLIVIDVLLRLSPVTLLATVTLHLSVKPPLSVVAVIVTVPDLIPFTTPFSSTVAIFVLLDDQVTFEFVASFGRTFATIATFLPTLTVTFELLSSIPVVGCLTVTLQVLLAFPSLEVQVIVAVPAPTAVITPLELTFATFLFELFHTTVLSDTVAGEMVAESVFFFPASRVILE